MPTDYTFTGQRSEMDTIGLMFYQSRFYDPALGRFAAADSLVPGGAQGLDRYAYVNNNPVRYTDPSGHQTDESDGGNYTWQDEAHDEYIRQRNDALKCRAGNKTYCSFAENHPAESATFTATALIGGAITETTVLGGGVLAVVDAALWRAGLSCIQNTVCRWFTGMASGIDVIKLPSRLVRVFNADLLGSTETLAAPSATDAFVTSSGDIAGITTSEGLATKLTLVDREGNLLNGPFAVLEFDAPASGLASPINRTTPGFIGHGVTAGGAQEFIVPNFYLDELENLIQWTVK